MPEEKVVIKCKHCGERLVEAKVGAKAVAELSHPGGPNACIALALVRLRRSLKSVLREAVRDVVRFVPRQGG